MRIWDVPPSELCRKHLLGEHRELHGLWNIITLGKTGYLHHPETQRWIGKRAALHARHEALVTEMHTRGYNHATDLDAALSDGQTLQDVYINTPDEQRLILRDKPCECYSL